jgi:formiminotetrahydrofolate cyclodeaminase
MVERMMEQSLQQLLEAIAAPTPSPGGGSAAAIAGLLSGALVRMVAHLTLGRKKYAGVSADMQAVSEAAASYSGELAVLAEDDARAYGEVMDAYKLPKGTDTEVEARQVAIEAGLHRAAQVPLRTAQVALRILELVDEAAAKGNPNALTDAGVSALLAATAIDAAGMNVRVNIKSLDHKPTWALDMEKQLVEINVRKEQLAQNIRAKVLESIT